MTYKEVREKLLKDSKVSCEFNKLNPEYDKIKKDLTESIIFEELLRKIKETKDEKEKVELFKEFEQVKVSSMCWTCKRNVSCPAWSLYVLQCKFFKENGEK